MTRILHSVSENVEVDIYTREAHRSRRLYPKGAEGVGSVAVWREGPTRTGLLSDYCGGDSKVTFVVDGTFRSGD